MKRVIKILGILMLTFFMVLPCFAGKRINLIRTAPQIRSIPTIPIQLPVEAEIDDNTRMLTVVFLEDMGNVTVIVTNSAGEQFYNEVIETAPSLEVPFSLDNASAGDYQVLIEHKGHADYLGSFEIY